VLAYIQARRRGTVLVAMVAVVVAVVVPCEHCQWLHLA
jgi:hypothetical protein